MAVETMGMHIALKYPLSHNMAGAKFEIMSCSESFDFGSAMQDQII